MRKLEDPREDLAHDGNDLISELGLGMLRHEVYWPFLVRDIV
jgi:hypothetical protein